MRLFHGLPVRDNPTAGGMDRIVCDYAHCGGNGGKVRHDTERKRPA